MSVVSEKVGTGSFYVTRSLTLFLNLRSDNETNAIGEGKEPHQTILDQKIETDV